MVTWVGVDVEGSIGTDEDDGVAGDAMVDGCMAGGVDIDADIAGFVTGGVVDTDADMDGCVAGSVDEDPDMDGCMLGRPDEDPDVDGCVAGGEVTAEVAAFGSNRKIFFFLEPPKRFIIFSPFGIPVATFFMACPRS